MIKLEFKKSLYSPQLVMRAAYVFTDQAYIYLDEDEKSVFVYLEEKPGNSISEIQGEFKNELLAQELRESVNQRTGRVREIILQRALSSSMVLSQSDMLENLRTKEINYDLDSILKDWFE